MTSWPSQKPDNTHDKGGQKIAEVLLVEDSNADIALTNAILKRNRIRLNLHSLRDGEEAINLLGSSDPFVKTISLILLDFNLPKRNGLEVLQFIQGHKTLQSIPVIMLTGSDDDEDMRYTKKMGACGYLIKPLNEERLKNAVADIPSLRFVVSEKEKFLYAQ